jgi:hypothetical protein
MVIQMTTRTRRELLKSGLAVSAGQLNLGLAGELWAYAEPAGAGAGDQSFYPGALPSRSDVVMSTHNDQSTALDQLRAFHATRNDWNYLTDPAIVAAMKKVVSHVGLAVNAMNVVTNATPNALRADPFARGSSGVSRDIDGKVTVAPWMKSTATAWNSIFNPATRSAIMVSVQQSVHIGADAMEIDDPALEYSVTQWAGGDFSQEALSAFRDYCQTKPADRGIRDLAAANYDMSRWVKNRSGNATHVDWRAFKQAHGSEPAWQAWTTFMKATTQSFLGNIREYLHSQRRALPLSMNVSNPLPIGDLTYLMDSADYLISEIYHLQWPRQLAAYHATAAAWRLPFVPSIVPVSTQDAQWGVAYAYALGDNPLVPWNIYIPNQPRYFGSVSDFGSLYGFVRANARYFDGYDEIADVSLVVDESSANQDTVPNAAQVCLEMGLSFRLVVLRPNMTMGTQPTAFRPQLVVAVNCPTSRVQGLFPTVPVRSLSDLQTSSADAAVRRTIRTITPDPQRIVAIPRVNKGNGTLLIHVVDATKSNRSFGPNDYLGIEVPQPYWSYFSGFQHALLIRPNGGPLQRPLSIKQSPDVLSVRVPLAGISGWGVLVFDRTGA